VCTQCEELAVSESIPEKSSLSLETSAAAASAASSGVVSSSDDECNNYAAKKRQLVIVVKRHVMSPTPDQLATGRQHQLALWYLFSIISS